MRRSASRIADTATDAGTAQGQLRELEIRAAFDPVSGDLYTASAGGTQDTAAATELFSSVAEATGTEVAVHDVVALPAADRMGTSIVYLGIGAIAGGFLSGLLVCMVVARLRIGWQALAVVVAYYTRYGGASPERTGARHATIAPYGPVTSGDGGAVLLAVQNQREWSRLCTEVLEQPELIEDPRFATNPARVANRSRLEPIIAAAVQRYTADEFAARLDAASIANARMNTMAQLSEHPVLAERNRWCDVLTPGGPIAALLPPANLGGLEARMGPVPGLGEHTDSILAGLGRSAEEIARLRGASVI